MLKLLITGRTGRMGQALIEAARARASEVVVATTHDRGEDLHAAMQAADCVIDFTVHHFTEELLACAQAHGTALVIGTTGHTTDEQAAITSAAQKLPIVHSPNYSMGVNALFWLTHHAARILSSKNFDIEVFEMHHRHKIDAPSGTARRLLEILCEEVQLNPSTDIAHGRHGNIGPRPPRQIGMHTLRGGDVVGDHTVIFAADGERLELSHKASSRHTFAAGAVQAALWLQGRPPGLYSMADVLGL